MGHLYNKLKNAGFTRQYIKKSLPDWWDDSIADTLSGKQYAALFLSKIFCITYSSLIDNSSDVEFNFVGNHRYKHSVNIEENRLNVSTAMAYTAARIASENFNIAFDHEVELNWQTVRAEILANNECVDLQSLVSYCHSIGIPIVFLQNIPKNSVKMDGIALKISNRPVIILTRTRKYGYLLFDLAHELGHIAKGHLNDSNIHIDKKIESEATDSLEVEANKYAFGLLGGKETLQISSKSNLNPKELYHASKTFGADKNIDPTHVVLNYAYVKKQWPIAMKTLSMLCKNQRTDQSIVLDKLYESINHDLIKEDDLALLNKLSGSVNE